jgi:hypothetical protein
MVDYGNMLADASDASSSSDSSQDGYTTTPEEESPPPTTTTAETIRDGFMISARPIVEMRLQSVDHVRILSTTFSHRSTFEGPLWGGKETLRFIGVPMADQLAHTSMELSRLFDSELQKKILRNETRSLFFHVLDFNFALIKDEVLGRFTAANREHYNAQNMVVCFTMSPGFPRTWTPIKLEEWISWRDAEDAAGRGMDIRYRVSRSFTLKKRDSDDRHPNRIRNRNRSFLNKHNLRGNKTGDMEKIKASFEDHFERELQRLGI